MFAQNRRRFRPQRKPAERNRQNRFLQAQKIDETGNSQHQRHGSKSVFLPEHGKIFRFKLIIHIYFSSISSVLILNGFSLRTPKTAATRINGTTRKAQPKSRSGIISTNL